MSVNTGVIYGGMALQGRVSLSRDRHRITERVGDTSEILASIRLED